MTAIVYSLISKLFGLILMVIGMVIVELIFNTTGLFRFNSCSNQTTERKRKNKDWHLQLNLKKLLKKGE